MKKKIAYFLIGATVLCMTIAGVAGCNKITEKEQTETLVLAELASGSYDIIENEDGEPVKIVTENGEEIDLTAEDVTVEKDENGKVISVTRTVTPTENKTKEAQDSNAKTDDDNKEDVSENSEKTITDEDIKAELDSEIKSKQENKGKNTEKSSEKKPTSDEAEIKPGKTQPKSASEPEAINEETPVNKTMYPKHTSRGFHNVYSNRVDSIVISTLTPGVDGGVNVIGQTEDGWYHIKYTKRGEEIDGWIPIYSLSDEPITVQDSDKEPPKTSEVTSEAKSETPSEEKSSEKRSEKASEVPSEKPSEPASEEKAPSSEEKTSEIEIPEGAVQGMYDGKVCYSVFTAYTCPEHLGQINSLRSENGVPEATWNSEQEEAVKNRLLDLVRNGHPLDHSYGSMIGGGENLGIGGGDYIAKYAQSEGHKSTLLAVYENGTSVVSVCISETIYIPETGEIFTTEGTNNIVVVFPV